MNDVKSKRGSSEVTVSWRLFWWVSVSGGVGMSGPAIVCVSSTMGKHQIWGGVRKTENG